MKQISEIIKARHRIGMFGSEHFIVDHQRPLIERLRSCKISLAVKEISEVIKACCRIGMLVVCCRVARRLRARNGLIRGWVWRWLFGRGCPAILLGFLGPGAGDNSGALGFV